MRDVPPELYRFGCPLCGRILKAPLPRAGQPGECPACRRSITLPGALCESWTLQQVGVVLADSDQPVEERTLDRAALLLAQGTCLEYTMGREQLPGALSVRQWRRLLVLGASRELIRLDIARKMHDPALAEVPASFADHPDAAAGHAWTLMVRYLHFNGHGVCAACAADRTGMSCIYQSCTALRGHQQRMKMITI